MYLKATSFYLCVFAQHGVSEITAYIHFVFPLYIIYLLLYIDDHKQ